jgi:hypothetical protein
MKSRKVQFHHKLRDVDDLLSRITGAARSPSSQTSGALVPESVPTRRRKPFGCRRSVQGLVPPSMNECSGRSNTWQTCLKVRGQSRSAVLGNRRRGRAATRTQCGASRSGRSWSLSPNMGAGEMAVTMNIPWEESPYGRTFPSHAPATDTMFARRAPNQLLSYITSAYSRPPH